MQKANFALFSQQKVVPKQTPEEVKHKEKGSSHQTESRQQRSETQESDSGKREWNIRAYKRNIEEKSHLGYQLAYDTVKQTDPEKFLKLQRFDQFLNKMDQLYRAEKRQKKLRTQKVNNMKQAPFYSIQPVKDLLKQYNELANKGFDQHAAAQTLEVLNSVLSGRGYRPRVMHDYTQLEFEQSWRMARIVDDLKVVLQENKTDLGTHCFGRIANALGDIGYKNTELIKLQMEKVNHLIADRHFAQSNKTGEVKVEEYNLEKYVFGSRRNFEDRHYVFKGFQTSNEFQEYLTILLEWEADKQIEQKQEIHLQQERQKKEVESEKSEAQDLQNILKNLISTAIQVKELQKDQIASIESLRDQYFKMQESTDKYKFLLDNPYIKYEMLELQEQLVGAGFLEPKDLEEMEKLQESQKLKMQRAASIFYDYVLNYENEFLSPQIDQYYQAALELQNKRTHKKPKVDLEENNNLVNLNTLSEILTGISKQAMSYRRDVLKKDYMNKFYEQYLLPNEQINVDKDVKKYLQNEYVQMEREYLKGWRTFKNELQRIQPHFEKLLNQNNHKIEGLLNFLRCLHACRLDNRTLREKAANRAFEVISNNKSVLQGLETQTVINGLVGLAQSPYQDYKTQDLAAFLVKSLNAQKLINSLSFAQEVELLWAICVLGQFNNDVAKVLVANLNKRPFERVDCELKYDEFLKLKDIYNSLEIEGPSSLKLQNKGLDTAIFSQEMTEGRYQEANIYDPLKSRVIKALVQGLTAASIDHSFITKNDIFGQQQQEMDNLNSHKYPYKPDIIMGYQGQKVAVFVVPERNVYLDSHIPDGEILFRQRLLEKKHAGQLKTLSISIPKVVHYDIENIKVELNPSFSLLKEIQNQIGEQGSAENLFFDTKKMHSEFNNLAKTMSEAYKQMSDFADSQNDTSNIQKVESFFKILQRVFILKQQADLKYDQLQLNNALEEIKFTLMKLNIVFQNLPELWQSFFNKFFSQQKNDDDFGKAVLRIKNAIPNKKDISQKLMKNIIPQLNSQWIGTRQEVELPVGSESAIQKSIIPEIINQKFMYVEDYFHYDDWKQKLQQTFDAFNLLIIPQNTNSYKFFYDRENHQRRVPVGIFPNPNQKRQIMIPKVNQFAIQMNKSTQNDIGGHDEFVQFEKDPLKLMVVKELQKSESFLPINQEVSFITNLTNVKQSLKSDYNDQEILRIVLENLYFTDDLINEHLAAFKNKQASNSSAQYAERNPRQYREFVKNTFLSKDREDPFTEFFVKEASKQEKIKQLYTENEKLRNQFDNVQTNDELVLVNARYEKNWDLIDKMLLKNQMENENLNNISSPLRTSTNINYDMKTLMKSEFIHEIDPDLVDLSINDEEFLNIQRRRAESKLIKMKILYKIHQSKSELTKSEKSYLQFWMKDLLENPNRNIVNLRDSLLPEFPSKLTINNIDAKSIYTLNSIANVKFDRDLHGQYALNDLVLELSHFLDDDFINKIETEIFSKKLQKEWGLSSDFKLIETRNKEIGIILNEFEEVMFRLSGQFDEKDFENIKKYLSFKRNGDTFDQAFYENDMKSLKEFIEDANPYDDRMKKLETWIARKEEEFNSRVVLPTQQMQKSDKEIFNTLDKQYKKAREGIVSKMITQDEYGNPINKSYNELTSRELGLIAQNLSLRLYLFNYEYPRFLPQVIKAVMEHPNLLPSDKNQLSTYCKIFELDWSEDQTFKNKEDFLSQKPLYLQGTHVKRYQKIDSSQVRQMMQAACVPYVSQLAEKVINTK